MEVMRIKARSFPRATLLEHCSLLGTDNVREQISEHIFASNGGYSLFSKFSAPTIAFLAF